jgi:hypothetical protein
LEVADDIELTIGARYAYMLLEKWAEIGELREDFRRAYLNNQNDLEGVREYVAKMTSLWGELYPKVQGSNFTDTEKEDFMKFQPHYNDPNMLMQGILKEGAKEKDATLIFQMDSALRMVLERLRITVFEGA